MNSIPYSTRFSVSTLDLSLRTRCRLFAMRWLIRPLMAFLLRGKRRRVTWAQVRTAGRWKNNAQRERFAFGYYESDGRVAAGHRFGDPFSESGHPVILWLHGGAFVLPAMPDAHFTFVERLCDGLSASAFLPDYRLAPAHPYPAGLDDCEAAYRLLLDSGVPPASIVLGGESAGGNLLVALLHRIRRSGLPMPGCAVTLSPALDLARLHGAPSRSDNASGDAMLPLVSLSHAVDWYLQGTDANDPEVSPLFGVFNDFPPTLIVASDAEILRDDSLHFAHRLGVAGVTTELALWPDLPHAFPLLEDWLPEASVAREQIGVFIQEQLDDKNGYRERAR
ncbi:alpha/beta hydrolase [Marinobacter sp. F4216]|uniref:alpha/beta hydrolase n=1 Tax=Marinobacter sp. F4216 TaxID=2874281 RepID=UPI001CC06855|nr:alpha/beta hydrolase [Marinobacter sp. F4216]MBZ2168367.1 alpha/beta hydrolase [Marinobacter sp. F4216]